LESWQLWTSTGGGAAGPDNSFLPSEEEFSPTPEQEQADRGVASLKARFPLVGKLFLEANDVLTCM